MLTLDKILSTGRPYGSRMESILCDQIRAEFGGTIDPIGNLTIRRGESKLIFSAHLDTVHKTDGYVGFRTRGNHRFALKECLGADDGAGIWVLVNMIRASIPGTYVFTVGEELGGIGAYAYAIPPNIEGCISFDRRGTDEVIWRQGEDTGSYAAALWVCEQLGMKHQPSDAGLFSDNAIWAYQVPECLNISVGYQYAHSLLETLDTKYLRKLIERALVVPWEELPIVREAPDYAY